MALREAASRGTTVLSLGSRAQDQLNAHVQQQHQNLCPAALLATCLRHHMITAAATVSGGKECKELGVPWRVATCWQWFQLQSSPPQSGPPPSSGPQDAEGIDLHINMDQGQEDIDIHVSLHHGDEDVAVTNCV